MHELFAIQFYRQRLTVWFSLAVVLLIFHAPAWVGSLCINLGMLQLVPSLSSISPTTSGYGRADIYPYYSALPRDEFEDVITLMKFGVGLSPYSSSARWALARASLSLGDPYLASMVIEPVLTHITDNPLFCQSALIAASRSGQYQNVDTLLRFCIFPHTSIVSDTLALTFIEQGNLDRAREFRPDDLYLNYVVFSQLSKKSDSAKKTLTRFSAHALNPTDERLIDYAIQVVPALMEEKIWDDQQTYNVLAFWTWRYPANANLEDLLRRLVAAYPRQSQWRFLLGELYYRQRNWVRAEIEYQLLEIDPNYKIVAALRLGQVAEKRGDLEQAVSWYKKPERGDEYTRLYSFIASSLNVPATEIVLGPNLVTNGGFEFLDWANDQHWQLADYATNSPATNSQGAFVAGLDDSEKVEGIAALRLDGLWMLGGSRGFYGVVSHHPQHGAYAFEIQPKKIYVLSGAYRTDGKDERVSVYLGNPEVNIIDKWLPATDKAWKRFVIWGCHDVPRAQRMQLILRMWSTGRVWFDQVGIYYVIKPLQNLCTSEGK